MIAYSELRIILSLKLVQSDLQLRPLDQCHPFFNNRIEGKSKVRVKLQAKNGCAFIIKAIENMVLWDLQLAFNLHCRLLFIIESLVDKKLNIYSIQHNLKCIILQSSLKVGFKMLKTMLIYLFAQ